jgi:hypothetical protein
MQGKAPALCWGLFFWASIRKKLNCGSNILPQMAPKWHPNKWTIPAKPYFIGFFLVEHTGFEFVTVWLPVGIVSVN